ncbi:MAG: hypothetical protein QXY74_06705 [Candidatus Bathyarchaeia archaeon]
MTLTGNIHVETVIRPATKNDLHAIVELVVRLKKLNEEFDPLLKVRQDAADVALKEYSESLDKANCLVYVCEKKGKVIGMVKAVIRESVL